MSEFSYLSDRLAASQINERVQRTERSRVAGSNRRSQRRTSRHQLAHRLHSLADRIDS